jgi:hypothetical protein
MCVYQLMEKGEVMSEPGGGRNYCTTYICMYMTDELLNSGDTMVRVKKMSYKDDQPYPPLQFSVVPCQRRQKL